MTHHVALVGSPVFNGRTFHAGDILAVEEGPGPSGLSWATFDPGALSGTPKLLGIRQPDGPGGVIMLGYRVQETGELFQLLAQPSLARARLVLVPEEDPSEAKTPPDEGPHPPDLKHRPVVGVRWCRVTPERPKAEAVDPLFAGFDIDWLHR